MRNHSKSQRRFPSSYASSDNVNGYRKNSDRSYSSRSRGSMSGSYSRGSRSFSKKTGPKIPHSSYIQKAEPVLMEDYTPNWKYSELNVDPVLQKSIVQRGYELPTEIQDKSIPPILEGRDLLGLAATGTGKTAAFLIPLLHFALHEKKNKKDYQTLIIAPTRELALQIENELLKLIPRNCKIFATTCVGGSDIRRQIKRLGLLNQFIIGTPGRLIDLVERKVLDLTAFSSVVLDEVDRMVDMGFIEDIQYLINLMPKNRQTLFFSATLNKKLQPLVDSFLSDPVTVAIHSPNASKNVHQDIIKVSKRENKLEVLDNLLGSMEWHKVLIFTKTKASADYLSDFLNRKGHAVESIHGDKTQGSRKKALENFKAGNALILVATDVAARGLDVKDITHVINFDEPEDFETYIHRVGRTGRSGKTGWAYTLVEV